MKTKLHNSVVTLYTYHFVYAEAPLAQFIEYKIPGEEVMGSSCGQ